MKRYSFKETHLGNSFASQKVKELTKYIDSSPTVCMLSMPGVGVTTFLRYFASTKSGYYFIFIDAFAFASLTREDFFKQLLEEIGVTDMDIKQEDIVRRCKEELAKLCKKEKKIVIILNRFNQMDTLFDSQFFANMRWLQVTNKDKIVLVLTTNRPFYAARPQQLRDNNLNFFTNTYYFTPYENQDMHKLLAFYSSQRENKNVTNKLMNLAGGHAQLLQLLLKSEPRQGSYLDPFIHVQLKTIFSSQSAEDRVTIKQISAGKNPHKINPYLLKTGIVKLVRNTYTLFTPLFGDYIASLKTHKLPVRESRLLTVLKKNLEHVVSKDEIIQAVWGEDWEEATDWALNSLIYRLRKHPQVINIFTIENHKKTGYLLTKI